MNVTIVLAPVLLAGCASVAVHDTNVLDARVVSQAPVLDGRDDDEAWRGAREIVVPLEGAGPKVVHLRAVVHGDVLHLLARWPDATGDVEHKVWTAMPGGKMVPGLEREDVFAVSFPISGEFTGDMLSPVECVWDVWHWKSARTDPAGYAMDKSHRNSFTDPGGKRYQHAFEDGTRLHITRPEDAGTSATRTIPAPPGGSGRTPQYAAQTPSGSAADVRAKGEWREGWWTVEFARKLATGNADDADLGPGRTRFAVAILDRAEDEDHSTSKVLELSLGR